MLRKCWLNAFGKSSECFLAVGEIEFPGEFGHGEHGDSRFAGGGAVGNFAVKEDFEKIKGVGKVDFFCPGRFQGQFCGEGFECQAPRFFTGFGVGNSVNKLKDEGPGIFRMEHSRKGFNPHGPLSEGRKGDARLFKVGGKFMQYCEIARIQFQHDRVQQCLALDAVAGLFHQILEDDALSCCPGMEQDEAVIVFEEGIGGIERAQVTEPGTLPLWCERYLFQRQMRLGSRKLPDIARRRGELGNRTYGSSGIMDRDGCYRRGGG